MAENVEAQIASLRAKLGADTDAELASLLGVQRSAISQWRKRLKVPERAFREAEKVKATRAAIHRAEVAVQDIPETLREFSRALAASFVVRYSGHDATRLLRWASMFDEVVLAAAFLLQMTQRMKDEPLADCYQRLFKDDRFFEKNMVEAMMRHPLSLPQ